MIKKKVVILYDEQFDNLKKGEFFEGLISDIFYSQRYHISERVNFTGMEIDLIANHKDRINEKIYIECKARDNLSSTDIKSYLFLILNLKMYRMVTFSQHQNMCIKLLV